MERLKLNIQLFGASNSGSTSTSSGAGNKATIAVSFSQNWTDTAGNYSNVTASCSFKMENGSFNTSGSTHHLKLYWHDNHENYDRYIGETTTTAVSKGNSISYSNTFTVYHNSDGNVSGWAWASWEKKGSNTYVPNSASVGTPSTALWNIPRYFSKTPTIAFKSKTETSITYTWSTSEWCSGLTWNGGGTLTGFSAGTSGTITITGLSANSSYTHYGTFKRSDSGLTTNSGSLTNSTYDYPKITTVNSTALNIGNQQTLTISNPLGRTYKIYMYKDSTSGTKLYESGNLTTNGNVNFTPTASTLYASIPSAKSGKCVYRVTYGSVNKDTSGSYTYNCVETNCKPTISATTAKDTTNKTLTGNENKLIVNLSKPTVSMTASAKNSATISSYKITCGSQVINASSGTFGSAITTNKITYTVTDSRGYSTTTDVTPTSVTYVPVTISPTFVRNQPTDGKVNLSYTGKFFNASFGSVTNTLEVKWRVKQSGGSYGSWTTLSPTKSGNTYTQNVGTLSGTYDYTKDYVFNIVAIDKINTSGYSVEVNVVKGQPVFWWNSSKLQVTQDFVVSKNTTLGNKVKILGTAGEQPFWVRGIVGSSSDGASIDDLYLQYGTDKAVKWGKTGNATLNADGTLTSSRLYGNATNVTQKKSLSSKSHSNWGTNNGYVPDMSFIAYWNGAHNSSNNSNLTYCSGGTIENTTHTGRIGHFIELNVTRYTGNQSADWTSQKVVNLNRQRYNGDSLILDNNGIKAARACKVFVSANASINTTSAGDGQIQIKLNSNSVADQYSSGGSGYRNFSCDAVVSMAAGDHLYLYAVFGPKGNKEFLTNTGMKAFVLNT